MNFSPPKSGGSGYCYAQCPARRTRLIMRVSLLYVLLMTATGLTVHVHAARSQGLDTRVTIGMNNEPISELFRKMERAAPGLSFAYPPEINTRITLPEKTRTVKETLELAFTGTNLSYRLIHKTITITEHADEASLELPEPTTSPTQAAHQPVFTVTGKVIDASTQEPMSGVNILVQGTTRGTSSDTEGKYAINVEVDEVLVFSFIGYKMVFMEVGGRTTVDVMLDADAAMLQEVVVSGGYYETTDKRRTGSIVKVTSKEIGKQPVTSPLMALQGRVPSLDITPSNGAPGGAPNIRIRGENSLSSKYGVGGGYPLYVVDGVVIDSHPFQTASTVFYGLGEQGTGGIDPLINLNPENIESVEVLKDADATAIYGSRGANGVILITTKRASKENLSIDVSVYRGAGSIAKKIAILNTQQYVEMRREAFKNDGLTPSAYDYDINGVWDQTRETDWQKVLIGGSADITDAQTNFSAGSERTSFRLGGAFHKETTIFPGDFGQKRANGNFNLSHFSMDRRLKIDLSLNYGVSAQNMFNANLVGSAFTLPPNAPGLYNKDGSLNWQIITDGGIPRSTFTNPLAGLLMTYDATTRSLTTSGSLNYEIIPNLILKTRLGYTESNSDENQKQPVTAFSPTNINTTTGTSLFGNTYRNSWIIEPQINYSKEYNDHSLNVILGSSFQENSSKRQLIRASGYVSDALLNTLKAAASYSFAEDTKGQYRYAALFARIGYDYREKYLLSVTARRDGSSRFGPGNQLGNFGAIGAAWIFTQENFIKRNFSILSLGKIRGSYGTTGSDQVGDYQFYNLYKISDARYQGQVVLEPSSLFNKNFHWEVTKKLEAAVNLGLFKDRISLEAAWYRNRSSNQLVSYQLPATTGFESILRNFDATVQNTGWEFMVAAKNIEKTDIGWTTTFNLTVPNNKLIRFPGIEESPYRNVYKVGESLSIQRLYIWNGVDPQTGEHRIKDLDNNGIIDNDDRVFMASTNRKYYGGILNTIRVKSFEFSFLFQFSSQYGKYVPSYSPGASYLSSGSVGNQPVQVLNRWSEDGDQTNIAKYSTTAAASNWYSQFVNQSDYGIAPVHFIRLKTASISYNFPATLLERVKLQNASLFLQGQNLLTFSNYAGSDPEVSGFALPQLRMITGGLQLKF